MKSSNFILLMGAVVALLFIVVSLSSCSKKDSDMGELTTTVSSNAESFSAKTARLLDSLKTKTWHADTSAFVKSGNLNLLVGNSLFGNWIWSNWNNRFKGFKVLNRGIGGIKFRDIQPHIASQITYYYNRGLLKRVFLYEAENFYYASYLSNQSTYKSFARAGNADFKAYYTEVRRQCPNLEIVVVSAQACPFLMELGFDYDLDFYNNLNKATISGDTKAFFCELKTATQRFINIGGKVTREPRYELFTTPDKIHMVYAGYDIWEKRITPFLR